MDDNTQPHSPKTTYDAAALAALRILVLQAPAHQLSLPVYQDALTLIARADGIQLIDDKPLETFRPAGEFSIQELVQRVMLLGMEITWCGLAHVFVAYAGQVDDVTVRVLASDQVYDGDTPHLCWQKQFNFYYLGTAEYTDGLQNRLLDCIAQLEQLLQSGKPVLFADLKDRAAVPA